MPSFGAFINDNKAKGWNEFGVLATVMSSLMSLVATVACASNREWLRV